MVGAWFGILCRMITKAKEKMSFEQRPEEADGASQRKECSTQWKQEVLNCKTGVCLLYSKRSKEVSSRNQITWRPLGHCKSLSFTPNDIEGVERRGALI